MKVESLETNHLLGITKGSIHEVIGIHVNFAGVRCYKIINDDGNKINVNIDRFKIVWEDNKMTKTFREVIADIKEGEVWVSDDERVSKIFINEVGNLQLEGDVKVFAINGVAAIGKTNSYTLQRPQYTFTEAFAEYESGEIIKSVASGDKYKKVDEISYCCLSEKDNWFPHFDFGIREIRGKWYINK